MTIDSPKWPGLAERIADRIRTGELAVGDQLPSQPELARVEGVSLKVVQKALDWLAAVGVVDRRDKVGTFVASVPADPLPPAPVVPSLESRVAALEAWRAEVEHDRGASLVEYAVLLAACAAVLVSAAAGFRAAAADQFAQVAHPLPPATWAPPPTTSSPVVPDESWSPTGVPALCAWTVDDGVPATATGPCD